MNILLCFRNFYFLCVFSCDFFLVRFQYLLVKCCGMCSAGWTITWAGYRHIIVQHAFVCFFLYAEYNAIDCIFAFTDIAIGAHLFHSFFFNSRRQSCKMMKCDCAMLISAWPVHLQNDRWLKYSWCHVRQQWRYRVEHGWYKTVSFYEPRVS